MIEYHLSSLRYPLLSARLERDQLSLKSLPSSVRPRGGEDPVLGRVSRPLDSRFRGEPSSSNILGTNQPAVVPANARERRDPVNADRADGSKVRNKCIGILGPRVPGDDSGESLPHILPSRE